MNIFLYEPRPERFAGLSEELRRADLHVIAADDKLLSRSPESLRAACPSGMPFLLADTPRTLSYVRNLRLAECDSPVLVVRDLRNSAATSDALDAGADDDVVLPIKAGEVRSRINSIVRRAGGHAAESVTVGEVTVFFDGRNPMVNDVEIHLSRREHAVLRVLGLSAGRVVTKRSLYDTLYGMSEDQPFDKVIDVYICKIRKKIAAVESQGRHYIETVRLRGYCFAEPRSVAPAGMRPSAGHGMIAAAAE